VTYAPRSLLDLGTLWSRFGGVNLGIVADQRHCSGYHLGKDRIYSDCACKPDGTCSPGKWSKDYSVTGARDKAGLTDAASAIDLGKLKGSYDNLYAFSMWLVRQCQADALGARDVREIIYSPDGVKVQRYSGIDQAIHTGPGNGDLSHRTHTHISYFRDSEKRDKTALFEPYFIPDTSAPEEHMLTTVTVLPFGGTFRIPANTKVDGFKINPDGTITDRKSFGPTSTGSTAHYDATVVTTVTRGDPFLRVTDGVLAGYLISAAAVTETPNPAPTQDCSDAVAVAREKDRTAMLAAVEEVYP